MGSAAAKWGSGVLAVLLCGTVSAADAETDARDQGLFLVKGLAHRDPGVRQAAANGLIQLEDEALTEALDGLLRILRDGHDTYAAVAAAALFDMRLILEDAVAEELTESLYDILEDPRTQPRHWAMVAQLVRRRAPDSLPDHVDLWAKAIGTADPFLSYEAVRNVEFLASRAAAKIQETTTELELLAKRKEPSAAAEAQRVRLEEEARAELAELEEAANARRSLLEPVLLSLLDRPCPRFVEVAVDSRVITVGQIGYVFRSPLEDRLLVLRALVELEAAPELLVEPLLRSTHTANQYAALEAAQLIGRLQDGPTTEVAKHKAVTILTELATLPNGRVRSEAAASIGFIGPQALDALPTLVALLGDFDADVRVGAAESLGELGSAAEPALSELKQALRYERLNNEDNAKVMEDAIKKIENAKKEKE